MRRIIIAELRCLVEVFCCLGKVLFYLSSACNIYKYEDSRRFSAELVWIEWGNSPCR